MSAQAGSTAGTSAGPTTRSGTRQSRAPVARAARAATAVAVLISAVVHLYLWDDGMREVDVIGPGFLLNGVGGIAIAVALLAWRHWLPLLGAAGFGAATLGAYLLARTVGLAGVRETITTPEAVLSAVVEVLAIALALVAWRTERRRR